MPTPSEILAQLAAIATHYWAIAVGFHLAAGIVAIAIARGWRPSNRVAALIALVPLMSAGSVAARAGSPFNAIMFTALVVFLVATVHRIDRAPAHAGSAWTTIAAGAMIVFGLLYPHFVPGASLIDYAAVAPTGLLPCPTLALVIGIALLADGFGSRAWSFGLTAAGLFYGAYGVFRLGIALDGFLIVGALALATSRIPFARLHTARA